MRLIHAAWPELPCGIAPKKWYGGESSERIARQVAGGGFPLTHNASAARLALTFSPGTLAYTDLGSTVRC